LYPKGYFNEVRDFAKEASEQLQQAFAHPMAWQKDDNDDNDATHDVRDDFEKMLLPLHQFAKLKDEDVYAHCPMILASPLAYTHSEFLRISEILLCEWPCASMIHLYWNMRVEGLIDGCAVLDRSCKYLAAGLMLAQTDTVLPVNAFAKFINNDTQFPGRVRTHGIWL
jgi:hypothetical protein